VRTHGSERRLESRVGGLECGSVDVRSPFVSAWWLKESLSRRRDNSSVLHTECLAPTGENALFCRLGHHTKHITNAGGCYCGRSSDREGRTSDNAISCVSTGRWSRVSPARNRCSRSSQLARISAHFARISFCEGRYRGGGIYRPVPFALLTRQGVLVAKVGCGESLG
jgi:hypothetical protein